MKSCIIDEMFYNLNVYVWKDTYDDGEDMFHTILVTNDTLDVILDAVENVDCWISTWGELIEYLTNESLEFYELNDKFYIYTHGE